MVENDKKLNTNLVEQLCLPPEEICLLLQLLIFAALILKLALLFPPNRKTLVRSSRGFPPSALGVIVTACHYSDLNPDWNTAREHVWKKVERSPNPGISSVVSLLHARGFHILFSFCSAHFPETNKQGSSKNRLLYDKDLLCMSQGQ